MKSSVVGIQKFDALPIDTMSKHALLTYVDGVDENEQAQLIVVISLCKKFEVHIERFPAKNNFAVSCRFDGCYISRKMFGKGYMECFEQ